MGLHEWCESVAENPLFMLWVLAVFVIHVAIMVHMGRDSQNGYLPRLVPYAYLATLFSLELGFFCFMAGSQIFDLPLWWGTCFAVLGNLLCSTVPIFIFVRIAERYPLRRNLAWGNSFLILSYAFLTIVFNGAQTPR